MSTQINRPTRSTSISVYSGRAFRYPQIVFRHNLVARERPSTQLFACVAVAKYMLRVVQPHCPLDLSAMTASFVVYV